MASNNTSSSPKSNEILRFFFASSSQGFAGFVTNPIDVIKTRMQVDGELQKSQSVGQQMQNRYYKGLVRGSIRIIQEEGLRGLMRGAVPGTLRDVTYSGTRIYLYEPFKKLFGGGVYLHEKILAGIFAGATSSVVATPLDVVKIRLQVKGDQRYRGLTHGLIEVGKTEGLAGLYKGWEPTMIRAAVLTGSQISSYDQIKKVLITNGYMEEGLALHTVASFFAGLICTITASPVDVIKTRYQNTPAHLGIYSGVFDCFVKSVKAEGVYGLYKGFLPNWMRLGPHSVISLLMYDNMCITFGLKPI
ncbi:Mitochondrial substrate carrier family protein ucpB [Pseudolycoriella hygida]|uniref:Mitochondrial substrate carrier family protein ucpB n=1 Tax=Pseudolycoriella hygida TaxID=35572 RepID=A0A9Q0S4Y4_9DIPT|nr:Mitochondrial substrate carrier family protein ucpB [Pseudolycoriella hygida]